MSISNDIARQIKRLQTQADWAFLAVWIGLLFIFIGLVMVWNSNPAGTWVTWLSLGVFLFATYKHVGLKSLIDKLSDADNPQLTTD